MKIVVTGGAGFIGSHVVDAYVDLGHKVVVIDNLSSGKRKNVNKKAKFYKADICDEKAIEKIFRKEKPDIVNHHAAQKDVGISVVDPVLDARINVVGSLIIIKEAVKYGVKKFIYANSGGASYGNPPVECLPLRETQKIAPSNGYGLDKSLVELYLRMYQREYGLDFASLRYSNVYGVRQVGGEAGVIPIFIKKMLKGERPRINGDGKQTRDFVNVKDVVRANVLALGEDKKGVFNISLGRQVSILALYKIIAGYLEFEGAPEFNDARLGEVRFSALDNSKAGQVLGWKPQVSLAEGVKEVVEWMKNKN